MTTTDMRGHKIYFDEANWVWKYLDTKEIAADNRPCVKCGKLSTKEGYDACLGYIPGATSACCGHGVGEPYIKY